MEGCGCNYLRKGGDREEDECVELVETAGICK